MRELIPVTVSSALRPVEAKANRNKNRSPSSRGQLYSDALFARFKESVIHGEFMTPNQHQSDETTFRNHVRDYMSMFYFAGTDRYEFDYSEVKMLGRGGYGAVYKAKNKWDNGYYAIKKIVYNRHVKIRRVLDISLFYDDFVRKNRSTFREVSALAKWNHPNVVRYYSAWIQFLPSTGETSSSASESASTMLTRSTTMTTITTDESYSDDSSSQNQSVDFISSVNGTSLAKLSSAVTDSGSFQPWSVGKGITSSTSSSDGITFGDSDAMTSLSVDSKTHYSLPTDAASIEPLTEAFGDLTMFIQMELCYCNLRHYIDARNKALTTASGSASVLSMVDVEANKYLFRGILEGVHYIHLQGHIHRDLKPHNIFLGMADWKDEGKGIKDWQSGKNQTDWWRTDVRKLVAKVGDFGLVTDQFGKDVEAEAPAPSQVGRTSLLSGRTAHVGTVAYAAPEQLSQAPSMYNETVDIYPLGIILFELYHPFGTAMERATILNSLRQGKLPPEFVARWPDESALIQRMMSSDPTQRPSAHDILNSPVFAVASQPNSPSNDDAQAANSADSEIMKLKTALEAKAREVEELRRLVSELSAKGSNTCL